VWIISAKASMGGAAKFTFRFEPGATLAIALAVPKK